MEISNNIFIYTRIDTQEKISNEIQENECKKFLLEKYKINKVNTIKENILFHNGKKSQQIILNDLLNIKNNSLIFYSVNNMTNNINIGINIVYKIVPKNEIKLYFVLENIIIDKDSNNEIKQSIIEKIILSKKDNLTISKDLIKIFEHLNKEIKNNKIIK